MYLHFAWSCLHGDRRRIKLPPQAFMASATAHALPRLGAKLRRSMPSEAYTAALRLVLLVLSGGWLRGTMCPLMVCQLFRLLEISMQ